MIFTPALTESVTITTNTTSSSGVFYPPTTDCRSNQLNVQALTTWVSSVVMEFTSLSNRLDKQERELSQLSHFMDWISVAHPHLPDEYRRVKLATQALEKANA